MADNYDTEIRFIYDHETKLDLLNNEALAKTVVSLIRRKTDRPITIGVHGDWGAGKSSVLEMIDAAFAKDERVLCIKFNGWQFQGFEDAKIAVIEGIVSELIASRSLLTKATEEVKKIWRRIDWLKVAKKGGGLAFTAFTGVPSPDLLKSAIDTVRDVLADPKTIANKENAEKASSLFSGLLKEKNESRNVPEEIHEFRKAFAELLEKAEIDRLVVLIDDLDRCLPETAIETLEAIRLFVSLPQTAFVVGADEAMIEYSVRKHFPDLPETTNSQGYARSYLEKLIQVPMRIPSLGETETRIYITMLLMGAVIGEDSSDFGTLLGYARAALERPWEGKGIALEDIRAALGSRFDEVGAAITLAEQISPVLAAGTKGNPRQIKRFLNALSLRMAVAEARGFGSAIFVNHLAKLMLAELFLPPSVFEHLATSVAVSEDGTCKELKALEQVPDTTPALPSDKKDIVVADALPTADDESTVLSDWRGRAEVVKWASIEPKLSAASLKPYLFVIKDRKNFLGAGAPLSGALLRLLDKLSGGEANAKTVATELRVLNAADVDTLFIRLQSQLLASPSLTNKPPIMAGISELVKAHPASLQMRYVELMDGLPVTSLGMWAATGHNILVSDPGAVAKLEAVKQKWAKSGTAALKAALAADKATGKKS